MPTVNDMFSPFHYCCAASKFFCGEPGNYRLAYQWFGQEFLNTSNVWFGKRLGSCTVQVFVLIFFWCDPRVASTYRDKIDKKIKKLEVQSRLKCGSRAATIMGR